LLCIADITSRTGLYLTSFYTCTQLHWLVTEHKGVNQLSKIVINNNKKKKKIYNAHIVKY